jgi:ribosomal protein L7Ae-like RNA K-turn-binding protein
MDKNKVLHLLGLCMRANKLISGEMFVLEKIKSNQAKLVFLANDAGFNTSKRIRDKSKFYNVEVIDLFDSLEISSAIGKNNRKAIGIIDKGFAEQIKSVILN